MPLEVKRRLTLLPTLSKPQLFALWKRLFRGSPPRQVRKGLLIRLLAYRMQEQAHGGLRPETRRRLRELARKFAVNSDAEIPWVQRVKPGTRLVREWHGQSHHVTILEDGYEYASQRYSSLSEIARLITGTRWSGPLFFGLKRNQARNHLNANGS